MTFHINDPQGARVPYQPGTDWRTIQGVSEIQAERQFYDRSVRHLLKIFDRQKDAQKKAFRAQVGAPHRKKVRDIMTWPVISVGPNASIQEVCSLVLNERVRYLPVVGADKTVLGMVDQWDLFDVLFRHKGEATDEIRHTMRSPVLTVHGEAELEEAIEVMLQERLHVLPVVDDKGILVGIVTSSDCLAAWKERHGGKPIPRPKA